LRRQIVAESAEKQDWLRGARGAPRIPGTAGAEYSTLPRSNSHLRTALLQRYVFLNVGPETDSQEELEVSIGRQQRRLELTGLGRGMGDDCAARGISLA